MWVVNPGRVAVSSLVGPPNAELCASEISTRPPGRGLVSWATATLLLASSLLFASSCSTSINHGEPRSELGGAFAAAGSGVAGGGAGVSSGGMTSSAGGRPPINTDGANCTKKTCAELGWACGYTVDKCK